MLKEVVPVFPVSSSKTQTAQSASPDPAARAPYFTSPHPLHTQALLCPPGGLWEGTIPVPPSHISHPCVDALGKPVCGQLNSAGS